MTPRAQVTSRHSDILNRLESEGIDVEDLKEALVNENQKKRQDADDAQQDADAARRERLRKMGETKARSPQEMKGGGSPKARPLVDSTGDVGSVPTDVAPGEGPPPEGEVPTPESDQAGVVGLGEDGEPLTGGADAESARLAREERMRLMPEYLENFFIDDLPPIDPSDAWNQGIFIRFRLNQVRQAKGLEPVV